MISLKLSCRLHEEAKRLTSLYCFGRHCWSLFENERHAVWCPRRDNPLHGRRRPARMSLEDFRCRRHQHVGCVQRRRNSWQWHRHLRLHKEEGQTDLVRVHPGARRL